MKKIALSLVNYNSKSLILRCLEQIFSEKYDNEIEVWVVDNASPDDIESDIKEKYKKVHLLKNDQNLGFGKAHNQVLKNIDSDFTLLINPDTQWQKGSIDRLVSFMEDNNCDIASGKIFDYQGNLQSNGGDFPFGVALVSWLFNLEFFGVRKNFHRDDAYYYKDKKEVDWVGGTFMMIRNKSVSKIGFFDEKIFLYFEDTDLCFRAKKEGLKIMIDPEIEIKHIGGASSKNPQFMQWSGEFKGLIYFYQKNIGFFGALVVRLLIYLSLLLRVIAFSIIGKFNYAKTYIKVLPTF